ncbi:MAG: hypothetical protein AAFZ06_06405 [Pseudomonadota bacterium]
MLGGLAVAERVGSTWVHESLAADEMDPNLMGAILLVYVAMLALPFVPGAEIGLLLLLTFGAEMAVPVYLATVLALMLSYSVGRLAPDALRLALLGRLGLAHEDAPTCAPGREAPELGRGLSASPWLKKILEHRGLTLVVLLNTPGNAVLGGGGGIALAAGLSRAFSFRAFLFCVAIAVAPVPLAVVASAQFAIPGMASCGHPVCFAESQTDADRQGSPLPTRSRQ